MNIFFIGQRWKFLKEMQFYSLRFDFVSKTNNIGMLVAEEWYETAYDILFPEGSSGSKNSEIVFLRKYLHNFINHKRQKEYQ
jgi:hypothetical protein